MTACITCVTTFAFYVFSYIEFCQFSIKAFIKLNQYERSSGCVVSKSVVVQTRFCVLVPIR